MAGKPTMDTEQNFLPDEGRKAGTGCISLEHRIGIICTERLGISGEDLGAVKTVQSGCFFWLKGKLQHTFQHKSPNNRLGGFLPASRTTMFWACSHH